ncbi:winged helix-turn-helix transcriptional regulator [Actinoplanes sp. RD1]|uniref:winged helix-turn-helix transcriptional regulator n=1 Tax=Actinoplanes sp. RD1 TaxID=3064538 RepID=UPI00274148D4|nr:helix-turn-helix domain-containing protein [Actinoplanes sp. RD1]
MAEPEQLASALRLLQGDGCPLRGIFDEATSRWATLIMAALITGPHRFAELRDRLGGISEKMLAQKLKAMVRAGLVARDAKPTVPPQVTYSLTELGASMAGPLTGLFRWFGSHGDELTRAQRAYDAG